MWTPAPPRYAGRGGDQDGRPATFDHRGMLYRDSTEYATGCAAFVREGLDAGSPVLVAVPAENAPAIRDALAGAENDRVVYFDMRAAGANPGRILPGVLLDFAARHSGTRVSVVGEPVWPGRTPVEYPACAAYEALINVAFAGRDAAILCPYDAARLSADAIGDAWSTHPVMVDGPHTSASRHYGDPIATAQRFNLPLPPLPPAAVPFPFGDPADISRLRAAVTRHALAAGLPSGRAADLRLAVTELATNSLLHTPSGRGVLSVWAEPGMLVVQVDDGGHIADPMAGRTPPADDAEVGRGLILVHMVVDLVRIHTVPGHTSVRIHMAKG